MIHINIMGDSITGSYGDKSFGVSYSEEKFKAMSELREAADNAATPDELKEIYEEFEELTKEDLKKIVESEYKDIYVNKLTKEFFLKVGDKVTSVPMPEALVERIKDSIDKGIDATPLIKFWTRWLRNPILRKKDKEGRKAFSERIFMYVNSTFLKHDEMMDLVHNEGLSREVAEERCTVYQVKITNEGLLCTYKVSREITEKYALDEDENVKTVSRYKKSVDPDTGIVSYDKPEIVEDLLFQPAVMGDGGDAFYCEGANGYKDPGHFIKVGCTHRLPDWSCVNTNNDVSCVKGLHVGGLSYISGYQHEGTVTHNVFVDPMHVGAVPDIYHRGDGAIRCIQYFVHSSFAGVNGSIYHSSKYAEETDEQWEEMKKEILKEFGERQEIVDNETSELDAL